MLVFPQGFYDAGAWLTWTVPVDGGLPERPHRIGVLPPAATRADRLAMHWQPRAVGPTFAGCCATSTASSELAYPDGLMRP